MLYVRQHRGACWRGGRTGCGLGTAFCPAACAARRPSARGNDHWPSGWGVPDRAPQVYTWGCAATTTTPGLAVPVPCPPTIVSSPTRNRPSRARSRPSRGRGTSGWCVPPRRSSGSAQREVSSSEAPAGALYLGGPRQTARHRPAWMSGSSIPPSTAPLRLGRFIWAPCTHPLRRARQARGNSRTSITAEKRAPHDLLRASHP